MPRLVHESADTVVEREADFYTLIPLAPTPTRYQGKGGVFSSLWKGKNTCISHLRNTNEGCFSFHWIA